MSTLRRFFGNHAAISHTLPPLATGIELTRAPFQSEEQGFHYSTIERGGALNSSSPYSNNITPLACAAEDGSTQLWSASSLTPFCPIDDTLETSPSTLPWTPYGYRSKTSYAQSILFTVRNCSIGISTNAHPGSRFSGLSVSQTTFDADSWPVEADESSPFYQAANLSRPIWDVNAHSSSSVDPVSLLTAPLMNGNLDFNHAPVPGCQSMNDPNLNHDFASSPMADNYEFARSYLAPPLDYSLADSNFIAQSTGFDTSGYNARPAIADEVLSPNTLSTMGPGLLPENNNHLPQTQAGSPDETFDSEMSPSNPNEHGRVQFAHPNTCMECLESFEKPYLLYDHCRDESHAIFMCKCGKRFTRDDVLFRHVRSTQPDLQKHACPYCKSRPGGKSFKRKDHLTQHIRGYHHRGTEIKISPYRTRLDYLCPHSDCLQYRGPDFLDLPYETRRQNKPFASRQEFRQHMRTVHDEAPYPCDVRGCLRVGGKGYFRRLDLIKHRKREHPEAPKFKDLHSCRLPGCSGNGEKYKGILDHYIKEHGYSIDFAEHLNYGLFERRT